MNLLITGASGFLGKNIIPFIDNSINIFTMGLSDSDKYKVDLSSEIPSFNDKFDIVLHAAGKVHSLANTYDDIESFYKINYYGTKNLCAALEKSILPKSIIFISTVAVYGKEEGLQIKEDAPLLGNTPYALSKIKAEFFLRDWCTKNKVNLSILRPSLIAGPNPPGNLGFMIKGINNGRYLSIAGGKARKSILMVHDIAHLIPILMNKNGVYNICDTEHPTFRELEILISKQLNKPLPSNVPFLIAKVLAKAGDLMGSSAPFNSNKFIKITKTLTFSNEKIRKELGWEPTNVLKNFKICN